MDLALVVLSILNILAAQLIGAAEFICVYMYICIYIYIYTYDGYIEDIESIHIYIYMYISLSLYIYVYTYIHTTAPFALLSTTARATILALCTVLSALCVWRAMPSSTMSSASSSVMLHTFLGQSTDSHARMMHTLRFVILCVYGGRSPTITPDSRPELLATSSGITSKPEHLHRHTLSLCLDRQRA